MFVGFFYLLRQRGFGVSLNEWMTLMEGLSLGLHRSTLTGFYDLCRAVLVKSEADYDKFDAAFLEYFKDVPFPEELLPDDTHGIVLPGQPQDATVETIRAGLQTLLDDPARAHACAEAAYRNVYAHFTWDAVFDKMVGIINQS